MARLELVVCGSFKLRVIDRLARFFLMVAAGRFRREILGDFDDFSMSLAADPIRLRDGEKADFMFRCNLFCAELFRFLASEVWPETWRVRTVELELEVEFIADRPRKLELVSLPLSGLVRLLRVVLVDFIKLGLLPLSFMEVWVFCRLILVEGLRTLLALLLEFREELLFLLSSRIERRMAGVDLWHGVSRLIWDSFSLLSSSRDCWS